ncbi:MAG: hypothetical protein AMXMBFR7_47120 [Planctomycetota bacterium]
MRFLVNACTGPPVAAWLRGRGHEVRSVFDECRGLDDIRILEMAHRERRILITNDKDFADRVHRDGLPHTGAVLLRLRNERAASTIAAMDRLLSRYAARLPSGFAVASETRVRFSLR